MVVPHADTQGRSKALKDRAFDRADAFGPERDDFPEDAASQLTLTKLQKESIRILVVDDDESICDSCTSVLEAEGFDVRASSRGSDAETLVRRGTFDIILLDLYMSGVSGLRLQEIALTARPDTVVIVITGKPSVESAIKALREGAWNYLPKPFSAAHLQVLVGRAAHSVIVARETHAGRTEGGEPAERTDGVLLLGKSPGFLATVDLARKVARTDASVFISGESGTGKELIAQYIHQNSRRSSRELVSVNCAALPETLLESEMFGHVKGSFTGAARDKRGLMEAANGGTLFLDEITEMSLSTQAKLLRAIQDGVVRRVGSTVTDAVVDVRFIAATNRDPQVAVAHGILREDLFYRLSVVPIRIPALRERPDDIPLLVDHFLGVHWERHHGPGVPRPRLVDEALRHLQQRMWKGNVRELENVIEHMAVLAEPGAEIGSNDVSFAPLQRPDEEGALQPSSWTRLVGEDYHTARERIMDSFERSYIKWVMEAADGNISEAARIARVDRTTLYRILGKFGYQKDHFQAQEERDKEERERQASDRRTPSA